MQCMELLQILIANNTATYIEYIILFNLSYSVQSHRRSEICKHWSANPTNPFNFRKPEIFGSIVGQKKLHLLEPLFNTKTPARSQHRWYIYPLTAFQYIMVFMMQYRTNTFKLHLYFLFRLLKLPMQCYPFSNLPLLILYSRRVLVRVLAQ